MKVGTDAILLGAWATPPTAAPLRILDIGAGSGVIALMLAQRFPTAHVDAVEIEPAACEQARQNFVNSPWNTRLRLWESAVQPFSPEHEYDLIVSNPPFFEDSLQAPDNARTLARHNDTLSLQDLAATADRLLTQAGHFCVILPVRQGDVFSDVAAGQNLICERKCNVRPTLASTSKRQVLQFSRPPLAAEIETEDLIVELQRHVYSPEYTALARDFLLKM